MIDNNYPNINYNPNNNNNDNNNNNYQNINYSSNNNKSFLNNKKKLLYIIGILLIIAIVLLIGSRIFNKKNSNTENIYNDNTLIKVKKNGKYGYIDLNGKFVINPVYNNANDYQGDYALVTLEKNVENVPVDFYQIIDNKGDVKFETKYRSDIEYIENYNIWIIDNQLYNESMQKISSDNVKVDYEDYGYLRWNSTDKKTAGIMNSSGKITYTYTFQNKESYFGLYASKVSETLSERYCIAIVENEKYAIVNCDTGKVVYNYSNKYISQQGDNIFKISDKSTNEFISLVYISNNKIFYQTTNKDIALTYNSKGYIIISDMGKSYNDRHSYLDLETGQISDSIPKKKEKTDSNLNTWETITGITKKSCSEGYGLVKGETEILPCQWASVIYLETSLYQYLASQGKNYVLTTKDNKTYLINLKDGKIVTEFNTSNIYNDENSTFIYYNDNSTKQKNIYNLVTGKSIETNSINTLYSYPNYITIKENSITKYYNKDLKLIYSEE